MPNQIANAVLTALALYGGVGLLVGFYLIGGGLKRFDALAARAPFYVKALWLPGMIALWPFLLRRAAGVRAPEDRA